MRVKIVITQIKEGSRAKKVYCETIDNKKNSIALCIDSGWASLDFSELVKLSDAVNEAIKVIRDDAKDIFQRTCEHTVFAVDVHGQAECTVCDAKWDIYKDKHPVGNIMSGTFKIYGKQDEQAREDDTSLDKSGTEANSV